MARKRPPGLLFREEVWHIDKVILGQRLCESCRTGDLEEAERYLARRIEEIRQAKVYGVRPTRTLGEAATKFIIEFAHKRSIEDDISRLKGMFRAAPALERTALHQVHMGTLQPWIQARQKAGVAPGTINHGLKVVRHILRLSAAEWLDEHGLTWLQSAPKIRLLPDTDKRKPYPLSWEEQARLFRELPPHLERMALFKVNTGCREGEVCMLRWEWEQRVPQLDTSVFVIPPGIVKNGEARLVILNRVAAAVIEERRGTHAEHVFTYRGHPVLTMNNTAWQKARQRAELPLVRVHDLKHTFGRRLRAAGVSFEDRQDLLGHRSGRITTHYSAAELGGLLKAANSVCDAQGAPQLVVLRVARGG